MVNKSGFIYQPSFVVSSKNSHAKKSIEKSVGTYQFIDMANYSIIGNNERHQENK